MRKAKRTGAFVLGALGASVLGVFGCNLIVDASDYHVVAGEADATTPIGDSSTGPETSTGANDGSHPGDSAPPGDSNAPNADASEDAADASDTCGQGVLALYNSNEAFQQLVKTCVLDVGCDYDEYYNGWSIDDCISMNMPAATNATACEVNASTCTDIVNCRGEGFTTASQCDGGANSAYCSGTNAVNCVAFDGLGDQGPGYVLSCTKAGGTCGVYTDSTGTYASCDVTSCNQPAGTTACKGNSLYTCEGDAGYGQNCDLLSATCEVDAGDGNGPGCYYDQPACPADAGACDGNTGLWCYALNDTQVVQRFNCAVAGLSCVPDSSNTTYGFDCVDPSCSDDDLSNCSANEGCSGNIASFCIGGAVITFDCASLGMTCNMGTGYPACAPFSGQ
jgi:hypothetical protein